MLIINQTQKNWEASMTMSSNLTQNGMKNPIISEVMEYAEPRMLSTLIVSGAKTPWDTIGNNTKTKIGTIPDSKLIGGSQYNYRKMGRIVQESIIKGQIGTSAPDGSFQLELDDNYIYPGANVQFYARSYQARVQGNPSGSTGSWTYTFKSVDGTVFDYNTMVAPQAGEKTCIMTHSTYGEASERGYGRSHYPDEYANHLTIQRKEIAISGDALNDTTVYSFMGKSGWIWTKQKQMDLQFMRENEWSKWVGRSSMKADDGTLLSRSRLQDPETGNDIIQGEGILQQLEGGNESFGSGPDGHPTFSDYTDMMRQMTKKGSNPDYGNHYYCVTGTDGYGNAQVVLRDWWRTNLGGNFTQANSNMTGGPDVSVGANFNTINFEGNSLTFVQHSLLDDEKVWTPRGQDGGILNSGMCIFLNASKYEGRSNIEILTKGAFGMNRSKVSYYINGPTGWDAPIITTTDALKYGFLKQDGIFIYNTECCGIIHRSPVF